MRIALAEHSIQQLPQANPLRRVAQHNCRLDVVRADLFVPTKTLVAVFCEARVPRRNLIGKERQHGVLLLLLSLLPGLLLLLIKAPRALAKPLSMWIPTRQTRSLRRCIRRRLEHCLLAVIGGLLSSIRALLLRIYSLLLFFLIAPICIKNRITIAYTK